MCPSIYKSLTRRKRTMKILVDADACPVKDIIEKTAKEHNIPVIMFIDTSHIYTSDYSKIITVDKGRDSADIALINHTESGDIVITADFGVASMALGKQAHALGFNGFVYSRDNIDKLMFERFLSRKVRAARHGKIKTKHNIPDKSNFEKTLKNLCKGENIF